VLSRCTATSGKDQQQYTGLVHKLHTHSQRFHPGVLDIGAYPKDGMRARGCRRHIDHP
jgi:hypothetical protein